MLKFLRTIALSVALLLPFAMQAQETVTIGEGTGTTYYAPYNSLWGYSFVEQVYLADEIDMAGSITAIAFNMQSADAQTNQIDVFMKNVTRSNFSSGTDWEPVTANDMVFSGTVTFVNGWTTIELDSPFEYDGSSNLMIGIHEYTSGYSTRYFYYHAVTGGLISGHSDNSNPDPYNMSAFTGTTYVQNYRANIQIDITPSGNTCPKPSNMTISDLTAHEATFSWESEVGEYVFEYKLAAASDEAWEAISLNEETITLEGLLSASAYNARVKAICGDDDESSYRSFNFTTLISCPAPTAVTANDVTAHTATITWTAGGEEEEWWVVVNNDYENGTMVNTNTYEMSDLPAQTPHNVKVRAYCEEGDTSTVAQVNFTTAISCPAPTALAATLTSGNGTIATLNWTEAGEATVWQICLNNDMENLIEVNDEPTLELTDLTAEQAYTAKVRAVCGELDTSSWSSTISFEPSNKLVIGSGNATSSYLPTYIYYNYSLTEQIYTVAELGEEPFYISSIDFYNAGASAITRNLSFYMLSTEKSSFTGATDWVAVTAANQVFSGSVTFAAGAWTAIPLTVPFSYDGENNIILAVDDNTGSYVSSVPFRVFDATAQTLRVYSDETNYDPTAPSSYSGAVMDVKNQIRLLTTTEAPTCFIPSGLTNTQVGPHDITLNWTENGEATEWIVAYKPSNATEFTEVEAAEKPFVLEGLAAATTYNVKVRPVCDDESEMWSNVLNVTTLISCPAVTNAHVSEITPNSATIEWTIGAEEEAWMVYVDGDQEGELVEEPMYVLGDLEPVSAHTVVIKAYCGEEDLSTAVTVNCTTLVACPAPTGLAATLTPGNGTIATLSWNAQGSTAWEICLNNDEENLISATEATYDLTDLTAEQTYTAKVRAVCDGDEVSDWSSTISFTPTNDYTITVADGTSTSSYIPVYGLWCDDYVKMHFVYPDEDLATMSGGQIAQMTFYTSSPAAEPWTGQFKVYLGEIEGTTLSAYADVTTLTEVYSGNLDGTGATMTIEFDEQYAYNGGNLLVAIEETTTGNYKSVSWYGVTATGASLYGYSGSSLSAVTAGQANFLPKTTFSFVPGSGEFCEKPASITVSDITAHEATVSWESEVGNYLLQYKENGFENWIEIADITDNTYTLENLSQNTTYNVRVAAVCGEESVSGWRTASNFTTPVLFPAPTNVTAATVQGNGTEATLSWTENGEATEWQICLDNNLENLVDADENPFTLTGLTPEHIYSAKVRSVVDGDYSSWSAPVTFQPSNKMVIGTAEATSNYLPTYTLYNYDLTEQIYTTDELGTESAAIMSVDFYNAGSEKTRNIDVYMVSTDKSSFESGTDWVALSEGDLLFSGEVTFTPNQWTTVTFDAPFIYDGLSNVILAVDDNNGSWSSGLSCQVFSAPSQAIYVSNDYTNYDPTAPSSYSGTVVSQKNHIRLDMQPADGCFRPSGLNAIEVGNVVAELNWNSNAESWNLRYKEATAEEWTVIENIDEVPYSLSGLTPETAYQVQVQSVCDDDEVSDWTNSVNFTTLVACPTPHSLNATDITATSATLEWVGYSDSYVVRYRPYDPSGVQGFEAGMLGWTNIDADGDEYVWVLASESAGIYHNSGVDLTGNGYNGSDDFIVSGSYTNAGGVALTPDNYLVSPQVQLGGSISFWAQAQDVNYAAEHFGVAVSTTSNTDPTAFTMVDEWTMDENGGPGAGAKAGEWGHYTVDLSAYEGMGYVAIRHFNCTDEFILNVDDILIETPGGAEENPWVEVTTTATNVAINGLQPNTMYEFQVQGICDGEAIDWTGSNYFTTTDGEGCNAPAIASTSTDATTATVTFTGDAENYEVAIVAGAWVAPTAGTPITTTTHTFTDLTPATAYTIGVRAVCGEDLFSAWTTAAVNTIDAACEPVSGVTVSNVTMTSATIAWTVADEEQTAWDVNVTGTNFDQTFNATANPYTVTGLTQGVTYTVKVRANCGGSSVSAWSETATFTTGTCQAVSNVTVSNVTTNSATISWTAVEGQTSWELDYGSVGHPQGSGTTVVVNTNPYVLTNLAEYTPYDVYVRAICEDGIYSDWSPKANFTTLENGGQGINDVNSDLVKLYPNPATTSVTIDGINGEATVSVVDMNGRTVYTAKANETLTIDLAGYAQGAYFVRISGEQTMAIRKLIVK